MSESCKNANVFILSHYIPFTIKTAEVDLDHSKTISNNSKEDDLVDKGVKKSPLFSSPDKHVENSIFGFDKAGVGKIVEHSEKTNLFKQAFVIKSAESEFLSISSIASSSEELNAEKKYTIVPFNGGNLGLINAINCTDDEFKIKWIGCIHLESEEVSLDLANVLEKYHSCHVVETDSSSTNIQFQRFCKNFLWPIFHCLQPCDKIYFSETRKDWSSYEKINRLFAEKTIEKYKDGDIILINDYHLLLAPKMIKDRIPVAKVAFFLHVPFPSSEIFKCLPMRSELLLGVLASDTISFQSYNYARHFLHSCTRILGYECTPNTVIVSGENRNVSIGIFPIGINTDSTKRQDENKMDLDIKQEVLENFQNMKILFSKDKFNEVKGLKQKLIGFKKFLSKYPNWIGKVVLIQVALETGFDGDSMNIDFKSQIQEIVTKINSRYGSIGYKPISLITQDLTEQQYAWLLERADVYYNTSLRDGMNLTSQEYILSQKDNFGSLIISEFAGSSTLFESTFKVNPWDSLGLADTINSVLLLSLEQRQNIHMRLLKLVQEQDAKNWSRHLISHLLQKSQNESERQSSQPQILDQARFVKSWKSCEGKKALFIDYDSLIVSFSNLSYSMKILNDFKETISLLSDDHSAIFVLYSDRSTDQLDSSLGSLSEKFILCAENGYFIKDAGRQREWKNTIPNANPEQWFSPALKIFEFYTERTIGSWIEKKRGSIIWHYQKADKDFGERQSKECLVQVLSSIGQNQPGLQVSNERGKIILKIKALNQEHIVEEITKHHLPHNLSLLTIFMKNRSGDLNLYAKLREKCKQTFTDMDESLIFVSVGALNSSLAPWRILDGPQIFINLLRELQK